MTKRSLIAICIVVSGGSVAVAVLAAAAKEHPRPTPHSTVKKLVPHERREHDPYKPRSATVPAGVVVRSGPVVRGRFSSVQVNVDAFGQNIPGDAANEPSIAIDPTDPNNIAIGWRQFDSVQSDFRQAGYAYSRDAGATWTFPGSIMPGVFNSDPVLAVSPEGVFYYAALDGQVGRFFRSVDGGVTWSDPAIFCDGFCDKDWVAVDHSGGVGRGNIYIVSNGGGLTGSTDGGATFGIQAEAGVAPNATLSVDDVGNVYLFALLFTETTASVSHDARLGIPQPRFIVLADPELQNVNRIVPTTLQPGGPNGFGSLGQPWIAAAPPDSPCPGRVHVLFSTHTIGGDPLDVAFARSENRGVTWSEPVRVNDDPMDNGAVQWFGTMSVAPNGRVDAIWNDTRNTGRGNLSEVFYSFSYDGGATWSKNVPVTPAWDSSVGFPQQQKIGDYYDMISDDGGANLAYAATFNGEQDVYFIRLIPEDCNGNGVPDAEDIASGFSADIIANGIPDECETDIDGDLVSDRCDADLDNDGVPNVDDLCPRVPLFLPADADGRAPQDTDGDCRIALNDYHRMQPCLGLSIPGATSEICVARFDTDGDLDVDLADFRLFQLEFGHDGR